MLKIFACQRYLAYGITLTLMSGCSYFKSKKSPMTESENPATGLPLITFYQGTLGNKLFIAPDEVNNTIATLSTAKQGRVSKLDYSRLADIEVDSTWDKLSKIRAPSYAVALQMLTEYGSDRPVLISASMIDGYLKYQNDLWYAALELALDQKIPGMGVGRASTARLILEAMKDSSLDAPTIGRVLTQNRDIAAADTTALQALWSSDPFQFKPISFYSDDDSLKRIWTSDRVLLNNVVLGGAEINSFNTWWSQHNSEGKKALAGIRSVFAKVTNKPDPALYSDDGFSVLVNADRRAYECDGQPCGKLWPASSPGILERLPAGDRKKYDAAAKAQPDMDVIVAAIKAGSLSLKPADDEGYFIYQRYALEPLLRRSNLPEDAIVSVDEKMQEVWTEVYKAGSAKALETHQKVIDTGGVKATSVPISSTVKVSERLILEPLPTVYKRYAQGYGFLASYVATLPAEFKANWLINGVGIESFIAILERRMYALYLVSVKQLGLPIGTDVKDRVAALSEEKLLGDAQQFLTSLTSEPAMAADQRFLAVQGRPGGPKSDHCSEKPATFWSTLGIEALPVTVTGAIDDGNSAESRSFRSDMVVLIDHFAELKACVNEPLTRKEWRQLLEGSKDTAEAAAKLLQQY